MTYYTIAASKFPEDIGARGYDQIQSADRSPELQNDLLGSRSTYGIEEASKAMFELRHNSKITDVIWSGIFSQVWFVNLRFLSIVEKYRLSPFHIAPANLRYRNKYLDDYFLFQMIADKEEYRYGEIIDFTSTEFEVKSWYQSDIKPERRTVTDFLGYQSLLQECKDRHLSMKLIRMKFKEPMAYDFFFLKGFASTV